MIDLLHSMNGVEKKPRTYRKKARQAYLAIAKKWKVRAERNARNHVEGKIGQGKHGYGLNDIRARRQDTSESWIQAIHFIMNLQTLMVLSGKYFLLFFSSLQKLGMHLKDEMRCSKSGKIRLTSSSSANFNIITRYD